MKLYGLLVLLLTLFVAAMAHAAPPERCVVIQTRDYYSGAPTDDEPERDSVLRNIDICLTFQSKSVEYELPALPQPLTLTAVDGATIIATVMDMNYPHDPVVYTGTSVTFELPDRGEGTKYRLRVSVPVYSQGLILGKFGETVIGKILMLTEVSDNPLNPGFTRTNLYVALGGLSGDFWFTTLSRPEGTTVQVSAISEPVIGENGVAFTVSGPFHWQYVWYEQLNQPAKLTFRPEDGGYFAFRVSFPNSLAPTRWPDFCVCPTPAG